MRIIAFIEDEQLIKKILIHLGLWETKNHCALVPSTTHIPELTYDNDYSQIPAVDYWLQKQTQGHPLKVRSQLLTFFYSSF
jgi:hypothetical protein